MNAGLSGPDILWLVSAALAAGLVRGFTGFGTGLVYLPVAAQILPPFQAIATIIAMDLIGPVPNLKGAWSRVNRQHLGRLLLGLALFFPIGLWALALAAPEIFRVLVAGVTLLMVVLLLSGVRYRRGLSPRAVFATGAAGGLLGGVAGLPGPPVILTYMAGPHRAETVRATTMLYLWGFDVLAVAVFLIAGLAPQGVLLLGFLLTVPNLAGNVLGGRLFRPGHERLYRGVALSILTASAVSALPIWG
ncbi:MAG: TSUP family transporter [Pseudomonadota bacterium]